MAMLVPARADYGIRLPGLLALRQVTHGLRCRDLPTIHHACLAPAACSWPDRQAPRRNLLSTTEEAPAAGCPGTGIADPAPLGLAAFALTTFLLSAIQCRLDEVQHRLRASGYAFAYGGLVQLLAGMWEFRNRNVFGATAFSSYGGFWIGLGLWVKWVAPTAGAAAGKDLGWILLSFAIFNTYMLIVSTQLNRAVFGVFLTLELTEIFLFIGNLSTKTAALPPFATGNTSIDQGRRHTSGS